MSGHWVALAELLSAPDPSRLAAHGPAMTQADLAARSLALAGALAAAQVRTAGLWFDDAAELACALLACWRTGTRAILPSDVQPATCAELDGEIDLWLSDAALPGTAGRTASPAGLIAQTGAAALSACRLDPASAGIVLLTSGSSGSPKRILKTWDQLASEVEALQRQWPAHAGATAATVMGSVSPHHMYGLIFRVLWPLCSGRPILRPQLVYPEELQRAAARHAPAIWISSPALLRRCGPALDWTALGSRVERIFSAGGPLPEETAGQFAARLDLLPTEIYGSSETGIIAWRQGAGHWRAFAGARIGADERQALWVESPWTALAREQTADTVRLCDAGFELQGRLDRIVKIEEKRIALPAVERLLARHPYVHEAYVGKRKENTRLTALAALTPAGVHALRNQGRRALVAALQAHLREHLASLAIPRSWRFMQRLPRNAQDKLALPLFESLAGPRPTAPHLLALPATEAGERRYEVGIPLDLAFFSGHFPATPVVPGVAQIGWAYDTARRDVFPGLDFGGVEVLKFQKLLRPGDVAELTLRWNEANAKLYFAFRLDGEPCSSGRILHRPRHADA
ncbi:Anthranilate--CoA ligase [Pigmentiphaga humi]|uniref:Anthranilate--CoA ligase n=1 Tax=Pigmentiphaga humi TaxID=2478468 RepID=A0A3P4B6Y3_9BURK|nr:AMP-binding protein [Pigmentiphaga humi]VCU71370.1 Anthranilate--CoA ligase [Pigmentiphaga humi]